MNTPPPPDDERNRKRALLRARAFRAYAVWVPGSLTLITLLNTMDPHQVLTAYLAIVWPVWWVGLMAHIRD